MTPSDPDGGTAAPRLKIYTVTMNGHQTTMRLSDADADAHRKAGTLVGEGELAKTTSARNKARHAARDKAGSRSHVFTTGVEVTS